MHYLGIDFSVKNPPKLDPGFIPFGLWREAYLRGATQPLAVAIEGEDGRISVHRTRIYGTEAMQEADWRFVERLVKFLLWSVGGWRIYLCGSDALGARLQAAYRPGGDRDFDCTFFAQVYERPLEVVVLPLADCPQPKGEAKSLGGHTAGCRIGFDAGGSDRKVSAVIDGRCVYSEEVVWHPKVNPDPAYHYGHILEAFRTAASKLPRVDAIGVSSAGVFIGNAPMVASLFIQVPRSRWDEVKTIYDRAAAALGDVPIVVANDGDVSALAGAMGLEEGNLMGLAMGTSEAVGYVNGEKNVLGWINELAFAPVDLQENTLADEWSTDVGVGCKYFSQDAVIKLAPAAGIGLPDTTPAEKLKAVQKLMAEDDPRAAAVFETMGAYLAYTVVLYAQFYDLRHLLLLGRVMSGKGGELLLETCSRILREEFPQLAARCRVALPDEKTRRVGQSVAAATLPA